ncbi:MAG: helix-turn-helix transcriptional regulator [Candidatus Kapaibacterium sp.]
MNLFIKARKNINIYKNIYLLQLNNKQEISQRLENWIHNNFRTKTEFCQKSGMSLQSLNMYTSGKSGIGTKFLNRLREMGCDVEWLISGREANQPTIKLEVPTTDKSTENLLLVETLNRVIELSQKFDIQSAELQQVKEELKELKEEKLKLPGQTAVTV